MRRLLRLFRPSAALLIFGALTMARGWAAATLTQQIDPSEVNVGDTVTVTIKVQNGTPSELQLPHVDGLQVVSRGTMTSMTFDNGTLSNSLTDTFTLVTTRPGDFTIPAFTVTTRDGQQLHVDEMKIHALAAGSPPAPTPAPGPTASAPTAPSTDATPVVPPPTPGGGPVVMPPPGSGPAPAASADSTPDAPLDSSGQPAKVFVHIAPKTTDAFVGESIPMQIEFCIRTDVDAPQDSLPTIKGSDFLMNNLSPRPQQDGVTRNGVTYHRYYWSTAISAPKSGDFPLQMENDSYWTKQSAAVNMNDPFANFFAQRPQLEHQTVPSNQLVIHVHTLPKEGCPPDFSGAIGQFTATGAASPDTVNIGEPVTLQFAVNGEGNFGYVKAPALASDPAWKSYVPASKIEYEDESHTHAIKRFEQAVIPLKNGSVPLPAARFSYFDPTTKQYVSIPISLPAITVTGQMPVASTAPAADANANPDNPAPAAFAPNQLEAGKLFASLTPPFQQSWFWGAQGGLTLLAVALALMFYFRGRQVEDQSLALRAVRERALELELETMSEAVRQGQAPEFFSAARHAVQLHLGLAWQINPETITVEEIRQRHPALAESVEPLFREADEVIYSGQSGRTVDLVPWERRVREEWLVQA